MGRRRLVAGGPEIRVVRLLNAGYLGACSVHFHFLWETSMQTSKNVLERKNPYLCGGRRRHVYPLADAAFADDLPTHECEQCGAGVRIEPSRTSL